MKTVTDVNTVNQLLTYSKQAEAIDKSLTVTMGQYGETFQRGVDIKL